MLNESKETQFNSPQHLSRMFEALSRQTELLKQAYDGLGAQAQPSKLTPIVGALVFAIMDSVDSVLLLVRGNKTRDPLIIARSIVETVLNACFICAGGESVAKRAWNHALAKLYRDLERSSQIGDQAIRTKWSGSIDLSKYPEIQEALDEFTTGKGKERRGWTPEDAKGRLAVVLDKYPHAQVSAGLHFAYFTIYRHSSEIIHGTLFGVLHSLGTEMPGGYPSTPADIVERRREKMIVLLLMMSLVVSALIRVLSEEFQLPDVARVSSGEIDKLRAESWWEAQTPPSQFQTAEGKSA